jgi:hypothetical protein
LVLLLVGSHWATPVVRDSNSSLRFVEGRRRVLTKRDRSKLLRHIFFNIWLQYTSIGFIFGIAIAILSILWPSGTRWRLWMLAVSGVLILSVVGVIRGVARAVVIARRMRADE